MLRIQLFQSVALSQSLSYAAYLRSSGVKSLVCLYKSGSRDASVWGRKVGVSAEPRGWEVSFNLAWSAFENSAAPADFKCRRVYSCTRIATKLFGGLCLSLHKKFRVGKKKKSKKRE